MLLASDALFALVLFFSFAEISQISGNQPRNGVDDSLRMFSEHKSRIKRLVTAQPTSFSPTTDDDLLQSAHAQPTSFLPTTDDDLLQSAHGNVECGTKKPLVRSRIVGGTDAQLGSWPWQVQLNNKAFQGPVWCGGSILSQYWVLTAAHCFNNGKDPASFTLTVGEYNLRKVDGTEQVIPIDQIFIHPNFNPPATLADYDVALIKLKEPITFNNDVRTVCLPTRDFPPGTNCHVTGWGNTREGGNTAQILQQAQVPLVSRATCRRAYSDLGLPITNRMRCGGFSQGGVNSCQGDSGGPVVCPRNNKWYLMGIVSWAVGCARPNRFGVYSDVLALKPWVQETINENPTP